MVGPNDFDGVVYENVYGNYYYMTVTRVHGGAISATDTGHTRRVIYSHGNQFDFMAHTVLNTWI